MMGPIILNTSHILTFAKIIEEGLEQSFRNIGEHEN